MVGAVITAAGVALIGLGAALALVAAAVRPLNSHAGERGGAAEPAGVQAQPVDDSSRPPRTFKLGSPGHVVPRHAAPRSRIQVQCRRSRSSTEGTTWSSVSASSKTGAIARANARKSCTR